MILSTKTETDMKPVIVVRDDFGPRMFLKASGRDFFSWTHTRRDAARVSVTKATEVLANARRFDGGKRLMLIGGNGRPIKAEDYVKRIRLERQIKKARVIIDEALLALGKRRVRNQLLDLLADNMPRAPLSDLKRVLAEIKAEGSHGTIFGRKS